MDTTYGEDLEKIKVELAQKRNELALLVKQTIDQLDSRIPELKAEVNTLNSEVSRLETLILVKNKQSQYDENYWREHYHNIRSELENKINKKHEELDIRDLAQNNRDISYQQKISDLQNLEEKLRIEKESLSNKINDHADLLEKFRIEKLENDVKARKIIDNLNDHINEVNEQKLKQKSIMEEIESKSLDLDIKIKNAEYICSKINDAKLILDEANKVALENENQKIVLILEQEKLNELSIKNRAEIQRILNDQDALDARDRALKQREMNVKAVEASLNKG